MRVIKCKQCNKTLLKLAKDSVIIKQGLSAYCLDCDPNKKHEPIDFFETLNGFRREGF